MSIDGSSDVQAIFENILDRNFTWPEDPDSQLSADCKDLIDCLLDPDPDNRLGSRGAGEVPSSSSSPLFILLIFLITFPPVHHTPGAGSMLRKSSSHLLVLVRSVLLLLRSIVPSSMPRIIFLARKSVTTVALYSPDAVPVA